MKKIRNVLVGFVVICMVTSLIPLNAFAADMSESQVEEVEQVEEAEPIEEVEQVEEAEPIEEVEQIEATEPIEEVEQLEGTEPAKEVEQVEVTEQVEMAENDEVTENSDDPGDGRLAGYIAPEFYGERAVFSTRAKVTYKHNSKFDGFAIQKGIDISHWQNHIDWAKVKADGVQFAIIRVAYRGYGDEGNIGLDNNVTENLKGATAAGIPIGVYIFSQAITEKEAAEEAKFVLNIIKGYDISLPIVMDYEYKSLAGGGNTGRLYKAKLTRREATDNCLAFCKTVEDAGYDAMIYANKYFLRDDLYADEISSKYKVWLAHYTDETDYSGDYTYWQYSSTGSVDGIKGNVDMNFYYIDPSQVKLKLVETKATKNSISINWNADTNATGYEIVRKNGSKKYAVTAQIADPLKLNYTDTGLNPGTLYTYKIRPVYTDENGKIRYGDYSPELPVLSDIDTTTTISAASSTFDSVKLTWKKAANVTGYQVQRYNASTKAYETIKKTSSLSYTDSGKDCSTTYKYRIRPYITVGNKWRYGNYSSVKSVKTASKATGVTNTKVNIRSGASTSKKKIKTVDKGTKLTLTGRSGSWYKVSISVSGKTKTGYIKKDYVKVATVPAKTTVTVKGKAFDKVKVSWKKVSGASGYVVQRYNSSKKKYETVKTISKSSTVSYTDSSLNSSTKYKYRVRAYKKYYGTKVYGSYSSVVSGKTKASVKGKTSTKVNVRKGAGTSYKSYKTVKKGTKLTITGSKGSWYRVSIKVNGKKKNAYIMKKYVKL